MSLISCLIVQSEHSIWSDLDQWKWSSPCTNDVLLHVCGLSPAGAGVVSPAGGHLGLELLHLGLAVAQQGRVHCDVSTGRTWRESSVNRREESYWSTAELELSYAKKNRLGHQKTQQLFRTKLCKGSFLALCAIIRTSPCMEATYTYIYWFFMA